MHETSFKLRSRLIIPLRGIHLKIQSMLVNLCHTGKPGCKRIYICTADQYINADSPYMDGRLSGGGHCGLPWMFCFISREGLVFIFNAI